MTSNCFAAAGLLTEWANYKCANPFLVHEAAALEPNNLQVKPRRNRYEVGLVRFRRKLIRSAAMAAGQASLFIDPFLTSDTVFLV